VGAKACAWKRALKTRLEACGYKARLRGLRRGGAADQRPTSILLFERYCTCAGWTGSKRHPAAC
jgi:hypothetical protein